MKIISHRGNLNGPNSVSENSILAISRALGQGFDVEIDVWFKNGKYPYKDTRDNSIIVLIKKQKIPKKTFGICTDFPISFINEK